ncbi:MAG TPA: hypothetical protein VG826_05025 [Pirellulales bacterium]|nr:hypothetical protein [Pirellulales bacterium]
MDLLRVISQLRSKFGGFNLPASDEALAELRASVGFVPDDVLSLYRDHDGLRDLPESNGIRLAARLMPIAEVIEIQRAMQGIAFPTVGEVLWLWTDDNSNYCGIYIDGLLSGWLCVLDHEEPMLTPAFRSVASFVRQLWSETAREDGKHGACDIPRLLREIPQTAADPKNREKDWELSRLFLQRYRGSDDEDLRRLFAFCSICLTPLEDTERAKLFFTDPDTWTPEAAVRLLELRHWRGAVDELETLAREGTPNGDSAAMRLLVRMSTNQSRRAISRLKQTLEGTKLQTLEMWAGLRGSLQPPRW